MLSGPTVHSLYCGLKAPNSPAIAVCKTTTLNVSMLDSLICIV